MRYANDEIPLAGDRILNSNGGLGTVIGTSLGASKHAEPARISVKWDEGIVEIEYDSASRFTLIARTSQIAAPF